MIIARRGSCRLVLVTSTDRHRDRLAVSLRHYASRWTTHAELITLSLTVSDFDFTRAIPFIEAIPHGRWTSFKDVAAAAGNPKAFMAAGNHMRDSDGTIDNYWRVIHSDGTIPENFTAPADRGPKDPYSAMQKLMKEGIRFVDGVADPNQYFSCADWLQAGKPPAANQEAAVIERAKRVVAEVNHRRVAKGLAPLTAGQEAEMLGRLAGDRPTGRG